jgi:hypothetical protein
MPESCATELNDLFLVDTIAEDVQFWSMIVAGVSAGIILIILWSNYDFERRKLIDKSMYHLVSGNNPLSPDMKPSAPLLYEQQRNDNPTLW